MTLLLARISGSFSTSMIETFLGRIPMIFNVVVVSPHGYFGQANVLGLPDTGGQIVYILDQVRALENEMVFRLKKQGLDVSPKILIVTRLIPDAKGTSCNQRLERISGTQHTYILRVPFRNENGILRKWRSRFDVWPYLEKFAEVMASNAIFLIVVIFVPFSLGRIVLYYLSWFFSSASNPMLAKVMPFTESVISLANDTLKSALNAVKNLSSDSHNEGVIGHVIEVVTQSLKINATGLNVMQGTGKNSLIKGTAIDSSYLSDLTTLAVGYMFIFCLVFLYIGSLALLWEEQSDKRNWENV